MTACPSSECAGRKLWTLWAQYHPKRSHLKLTVENTQNELNKIVDVVVAVVDAVSVGAGAGVKLSSKEWRCERRTVVIGHCSVSICLYMIRLLVGVTLLLVYLKLYNIVKQNQPT